MRPFILLGAALAAGFVGCVSAPGEPAPQGARARVPYTPHVPLGLDLAAPEPSDNRLYAEKAALGERLFSDPVLSRSRSASCATCHRPERYFTDGRPRAEGPQGQVGRRHVPSTLNVGYGSSFFWDGRASSLEEQVLLPIQSPRELDLGLGELERRLAGDADYVLAFGRAFDDGGVSAANVARALASYLRTLRSGDAPIDRLLAGDRDAMSDAAQLGFRIFMGKANCVACHLAPLYTDHGFHNTGVSWGSDDLGRYEVTGRDRDRGSFKVPSLRNVAHTAPYMHDGSVATLSQVIDHYANGGVANPYLDEEIEPLGLSELEKSQLIAFLYALTSCTGEFVDTAAASC